VPSRIAVVSAAPVAVAIPVPVVVSGARIAIVIVQRIPANLIAE
jgi:hypothetical protein